jgi:hypothetical protein
MTRAPKLLRLKLEGQRLATPELASGEQEVWPESTWAELVEPFPREVPLEAFHRAIDDVERQFQPFDTAIDAELAYRLHRALKLTRREAADPALWRFLTVVARPDFVRHRWENRSWATMRTRFLRPGTRPDSNALARLWWIAELTRTDSDYALTGRVLKSQSLANAIFVRSLSFYRPAVVALVDTLEDRGADELERTMVRLTRWLAVTPLEGLSTEDIGRRVRKFLER